MATSKRSDYGESSIKVLKGLEPVKQRPGMYTLTDNPLHIIQEVIDNSSDEVLAGGASRIEVTLHTDGSVTVTDDGRGIPVGLHKEEGVPAVQLVFTQLHAGGKFEKESGGAYSFAGGLHGVGVSVTNALSTRLEVTVWREGKEHRIVFADGNVIEPLTSQKVLVQNRLPARKFVCGLILNILTAPISLWSNLRAYCALKPCSCPAVKWS